MPKRSPHKSVIVKDEPSLVIHTRWIRPLLNFKPVMLMQTSNLHRMAPLVKQSRFASSTCERFQQQVINQSVACSWHVRERANISIGSWHERELANNCAAFATILYLHQHGSVRCPRFSSKRADCNVGADCR